MTEDTDMFSLFIDVNTVRTILDMLVFFFFLLASSCAGSLKNISTLKYWEFVYTVSIPDKTIWISKVAESLLVLSFHPKVLILCAVSHTESESFLPQN